MCAPFSLPTLPKPALPCECPAPLRVHALDLASTLSLPRAPTDVFVSLGYEVSTEEMWPALGYLALFILGFQCAAFLAMAYVRHILR